MALPQTLLAATGLLLSGVVSPLRAARADTPASWLAAEAISQPTSQSGGGHDVAIDPLGDAVAVWSQNPFGGGLIQAAVRPAGGRWSEPANLTGVSPDPALQPQVAVDAQGDAVAVWSRHSYTVPGWPEGQPDPPAWQIEAATRRAEGRRAIRGTVGASPSCCPR